MTPDALATELTNAILAAANGEWAEATSRYVECLGDSTRDSIAAACGLSMVIVMAAKRSQGVDGTEGRWISELVATGPEPVDPVLTAALTNVTSFVAAVANADHEGTALLFDSMLDEADDTGEHLGLFFIHLFRIAVAVTVGQR